MSRSTPWGRALSSTSYTRGIIFYFTASHGGFHLSPKKNALVHPAWRDANGWYEEDVEWNVVVLTFPEHFNARIIEVAHAILRNDKPDAYMAVTGATLTEADSRTLAKRALRQRHREDFVTLAAWGDWCPTVPKGKVGVVACKGGRDEQYRHDPSTERHFLVDAARYQDCKNRPILGYVVDLAVDLPWGGP